MKDREMDTHSNSKDTSSSEYESNDEEEMSDCDLLESQELNRYFPVKCKLTIENKLATDKYILFINGTQSSTPDIAVGQSNHVVDVCHISNNAIANSCSISTSSTIIGVQFSPENNNLIYTGSTNDGINIWDTRIPQKPVSQFVDTTTTDNNQRKPITCFDVSPNNRMITAGTELFEGDAFLLFWDVRNTKLLGGYWESHTDDITQVKFHPSDMNKLISGSTDGLINSFNLTQTSEDDALVDCLNTESSIDQLYWHCQGNSEIISCVTHTNDIQLWKMDGAAPFLRLDRDGIAQKIQRKTGNFCYVIGSHSINNDEFFILCGSNFNKGDCLRSITTKKNKFEPYFGLFGNNQIVRSSWFNKNVNMLVTGGEEGILNIWKLQR